MIYILTIVLLCLLYFTYYLNDKEVLAPSFLFTTSFLFACCWFIPYNDVWNGIQQNTFFVIVGGVVVFILTSLFVKGLFKLTNKNVKKNVVVNLEAINIEYWIKVFIIIFEIFAILIKIYFTVKIVGGSLSNFTAALFEYRLRSEFTDNGIEKLPLIVRLCNILMSCIGYWFGYVLCNNYIVKKKADVSLVVICLLRVVFDFTAAARGSAVQYLLAITAYYFLLSKKFHFNFKLIFKCCLCFFVFLLIFQNMLTLLGRESDEDPLYYLAVYSGAPIKNLDIFLQEYQGVNIGGLSTFSAVLRWVNKHNLGYKYVISHTPFRFVNGYSLGNVATAFRCYINDYGYKGLVLCTALSAVIFQLVYECAKKRVQKNISFSILIYGYLFYGLITSFFDIVFFLNFFNVGFLYNLLMWNLFGFIFCKINWRTSKI